MQQPAVLLSVVNKDIFGITGVAKEIDKLQEEVRTTGPTKATVTAINLVSIVTILTLLWSP
jgi:hypothetical protein